MEVCSNGVTWLALGFNRRTLSTLSREGRKGRSRKTSWGAIVIIQDGPIVAWIWVVAEEVVRKSWIHCILKGRQIWNNRSDFKSKRRVKDDSKFCSLENCKDEVDFNWYEPCCEITFGNIIFTNCILLCYNLIMLHLWSFRVISISLLLKIKLWLIYSETDISICNYYFFDISHCHELLGPWYILPYCFSSCVLQTHPVC